MQAGSFTLSRRHREAEARRTLGASHGGKASTQAGSLFRRHGEARMQEKYGLRGVTERQGVCKQFPKRLVGLHEGPLEASQSLMSWTEFPVY